jgi:hypothetical protein
VSGVRVRAILEELGGVQRRPIFVPPEVVAALDVRFAVALVALERLCRPKKMLKKMFRKKVLFFILVN